MPPATRRPSRPSPTRKFTQADKAAREKALKSGLRITVDGQAFQVRAGDLSALDELELRRTIGCSFMGLVQQVANDPGYDLLAAVIWLARKTGGEPDLTYREVASEVHFGDDIDLEEIDATTPPAEGAAPEA